MKRRTDPTTRRLAQRLDRAADIIPTIRDHLNEQRHHAHHAGSTDTTRSSPGTHSDPVARIIVALSHIDYREGLIDDALASLHVAVNLLDDACRDALGHRATTGPTITDDPVCRITGCDDPVGSYLLADGTTGYRMGGQYGGMCDRHRVAANRGTLEHK